MGNSKDNFLKQWFTFTYPNDTITDLVYSFTNNHYIQGWFESHGYNSFTNIISKQDLDSFIYALNESSNLSDFSDNFPELYISNYGLWDMDNIRHWSNKKSYQLFSQEQMGKILEKLWETQHAIESGVSGILKYNIYYSQ